MAAINCMNKLQSLELKEQTQINTIKSISRKPPPNR
jgi:hypothetical protein